MRKALLCVHVALSTGSIGAVGAFLLLVAIGSTAPTAGAMYIAAAPIASFLILPLIIAALVSGIVQALVSPWGLLRHYWVLAKLVLTALALIVLLLQLDGIGVVASWAAEQGGNAPGMAEARLSMLVHAAGGLVVLGLTLVLSVLKPRGLTRYGWRRAEVQRERSVGARR